MRLVSLKIFSSIFFLHANVSAFTLVTDTASSGGLLGWDKDPLRFQFNQDGCAVGPVEMTEAFRNAREELDSVNSSSLVVRDGGDSDATAATLEAGTDDSRGGPILVCSTDFSSDTGTDGDVVAGVTTVVTEFGRVVESYIILNSEPGKAAAIDNVGEVGVSILIAHEMGHALGLGHSDQVGALMHYTISGKNELRLAQDDRAGITYLYPRDEFGEDGIFGCASTGDVNIPPGGFLQLSLWLLLVWLLAMGGRVQSELTKTRMLRARSLKLR